VGPESFFFLISNVVTPVVVKRKTVREFVARAILSTETQWVGGVMMTPPPAFFCSSH
jgi:hypothetical protein